MSSEEVLDTYRAFVTELIKTGCVYKDESVSDPSPQARKQQLESMMVSLDSVKEVEVTERVHSFIEFFAGILGGTSPSPGDWAGVCKTLRKKSSKAHKVFFLHSPHECKDINVGMIAECQNKHNSVQIRNYLYILYCHVCTHVYGSSFPEEGSTKTVYDSILRFFEEEEEQEETGGDDDLKEKCKGFIDEVVKSSEGLDGEKLLDMMKPFWSLIIANPMLRQACSEFGGDISNIKDEIGKLKEDDIKAIIDEVKSRMDSLDLSSLMSTFQAVASSFGGGDGEAGGAADLSSVTSLFSSLMGDLKL